MTDHLFSCAGFMKSGLSKGLVSLPKNRVGVVAIYQECGNTVSNCMRDAVSNQVKPVGTGHLPRPVMLQKASHFSD